MRKLNLPYKKSLSTNRFTFIPSLLAALFVGCTVRYGYTSIVGPSAGQSSLVAKNGSDDVGAQASDDAEQAAAVQFSVYDKTSGASIVELTSTSCIPSAAGVTLQLHLESYLSSHRFKVSSPPLSEEGPTHVDVDGLHRFTIGEAPELRPLVSSLCQRWVQSGQKESFALDDQGTMKQLTNFLAAVSPDCQIHWTSQGAWQCQPSLRPLASVSASLFDQESYILRRWVRQPYLLSRRLTLTKHLHNALQSSSPANSLDGFCAVVKNSLDAELPLLMQVEQWQDAVCSPTRTQEQRLVAAHLGLDKAIAELAFFVQLADRTNFQNRLIIAVPNDALFTEEIWVQLLPQDDVWEKVLNDALALGTPHRSKARHRVAHDGTDEEDLPFMQRAQVCWHPLFAHSPRMMTFANLMSLGGESTGLCRKAADFSEGIDEGELAHYLAQTVMGETDFIMTNGRYKILRLPEGHYEYTLYSLPESALRWNPSLSEKKADGVISWRKDAPKPAIRKW